MMVSTRRALSPSGLRNRLTVLEIASTPVSDEPPLAKARRIIRIVAPITRPLPWCTGTAPSRCCGSYCGRFPKTSRAMPTTIISVSMPINQYVGTAKVRPASRNPRRLE